jgi:hypothetical protein
LPYEQPSALTLPAVLRGASPTGVQSWRPSAVNGSR